MTTQDIPVVDIDPFSQDALLDPTPFQHALREAGPFVWLPRYEIWATGRLDEVRDILSDWETFCSSGGVGLVNFHKETPWRRPSLVLEHDPPAHTHARAIIMRALSPSIIRRLRAQFEEQAREHVARLVDLGEFDAIGELAEGYPLKVFGDAVGLRATDRTTLLKYGNISFNALGPHNFLFEEAMREAQPVTEWIMAQCARSALAPDGLGAIMYAAADEGAVTEDEAGMLVRSFLSAGVDTTVRALGAALYGFAKDSRQWTILHEKPELARRATEEAIRYASPFQTVFRTTTREFRHEMGRIGPDEKILLSLGAANHDPGKWENPEAFDIERNTAGHVGFGAGIHGCVGQMLARLEIEVVLAELARQVHRIELAGEVSYALNNTVRGFARLPVKLTGRNRG